MKKRLLYWAGRSWPYLLITLLVLGPLLAPGYILTMDMVFVPHPPIPTELSASFPFYVLLHYLSYLLPGDVLQKLLLGGILLASGIGMDRLLQQISKQPLSRWAVVAASFFYMTSAFVYERLMMGQWAVIAGYALLPFVVVALIRFLNTPSSRHLEWAVGWVFILTIMSIHALVPLIVVSLLFVGLQWRRWRQFAPKLAIGVSAFLILSSYWLIPAFTGNNTLGMALQGNSDSQAFASHGGLFSLLRLQGMWAESYGLFRLPQELTILPGIWQTLLWIIMIIGLVTLWSRQRHIAGVATTLIVIGCLIALTGISDAYREPHKIMVLTAIGMSILLAAGMNAWLGRIKHTLPPFVRPSQALACLLPLLLGMAMVWGFSGQLSVRGYPTEWHALNDKLSDLPNDKPIVFVPWHLYQRYSFSPRIVANPAATFFEHRQIISSNDPEFAGIQPLKSDNLTNKVNQLLSVRGGNITDQLARLGIGYIIFAEEPGYEEYEFLRGQDGLDPIFNQGKLTLYEIPEAR